MKLDSNETKILLYALNFFEMSVVRHREAIKNELKDENTPDISIDDFLNTISGTIYKIEQQTKKSG